MTQALEADPTARAAQAAQAPGAPQANGPLVSIVIPCFNESANISPLFERLLPVLDTIEGGAEVLCVNDGSADDTFVQLTKAHQRDGRIKVIDLSRNFGKEPALSAGLAMASGKVVIPMDADLQHPPEAIPSLIQKWREGFEVVNAVRDRRIGQSGLSRLQARAFYWIFDRLSDTPLPREVGDFRLLDRKVVNVINAMPERTRFMKGIFAWVGFRQTQVPYAQEERHDGERKSSTFRLIALALDGITAFSNAPLRVWGWVGAVFALLSFLYIAIRIIRTLIFGIDLPGYESIIAIMLFLGGMQLLTLGVIGDYLGRVFTEVKGRPLFVVREAVGFGSDGSVVHGHNEIAAVEQGRAPGTGGAI
jgi:glycosyltransferase involved in cell wall biosynthesis